MTDDMTDFEYMLGVRPADVPPSPAPGEEALREARRALRCMRLEVPGEIADDVTAKVEAAFAALAAAPAREPEQDEIDGIVYQETLKLAKELCPRCAESWTWYNGEEYGGWHPNRDGSYTRCLAGALIHQSYRLGRAVVAGLRSPAAVRATLEAEIPDQRAASEAYRKAGEVSQADLRREVRTTLEADADQATLEADAGQAVALGQERAESGEVWRELERIWCQALIPEGADVIQRVTERVLRARPTDEGGGA